MSSSSAESSIQIGPYRIEERIGHGATGRVYRARNTDDELVAIKTLSPDADLHDPSATRRFQQEIEALQQVSHPNILAIVDHGADPDFGPYFVTPLITGTTLRALLEARTLSPEATLLFVAALADAVQALHSCGLVHRDLKPENVMITADGRVQLVDLGLVFGTDQPRHTEHDVVVGSVPYMSPERIEGGAVVAASDTWSLAIIAYECIAGRRPFSRGTASEEAAAILVGAYPSLASVDRRVDDELAAVIAAGLERAPSGRPGAADLAARLRELVDWCGPDELNAELGVAVSNPEELDARVARFRVAAAKRKANALLERGDSFGALRELNRGLAYDDDNDALLGLCDRAEASLATPTQRRRVSRNLVYTIAGIVGMLACGLIAWRALTPDTTDYANTVHTYIPESTSNEPVINFTSKNDDGEVKPATKADLQWANQFFDVFQRGMALPEKPKTEADNAKQLDVTRRIIKLLKTGLGDQRAQPANDAGSSE